MPEVQLTVHRSAHEIGGNCIEIAVAGGSRILLDAGRPLDAPEGRSDLLPSTLDRARPVAGVLISHPHQDHYGLIGELPAPWPIYCGEPTAKLMHLTAGLFGGTIESVIRTWVSGRTFDLAEFRITPILTDHSAFDAHMLLIEVAGKRILYSGDFRAHGRKSGLVRRLMASPPHDIDVLLMEGTNLGSNKPTMTEADVEQAFIENFRSTQGRVFVAWSAQNVDRTVSLYRACLRSGRTLAVDLYTAAVLEALAPYARLPRLGWPNLKVVVTRCMARMYRHRGDDEFVARMAHHGVSARALAVDPARWVVMARASLIDDYAAAGILPDRTDTWCWSMWQGYLQGDMASQTKRWFDEGQTSANHIHCSGHASPTDLNEFASRINPRKLVPIHGEHWDGHIGRFSGVVRVNDGCCLVV